MVQPLRVGVVGTGRWATIAHIPGFRACEGVEIVAICSRNRERGEAVGRELGIPRVYSSASEMLTNETLDLVSVVTEDDKHLEDAGAAIAAGVHVLCEKPLAVSVDDARKLTDDATDA